jgi:hypothetical protein
MRRLARHSYSRGAALIKAPILVTAVSPNYGVTTGAENITITGLRLTGATGAKIAGSACTSFVVVNDTTITCTTPSGSAATTTVVVTGADGSTASVAYTYQAAPTFTSITPALGTHLGGTPVAIAGTGFAAGTTFTVGGTIATSIVVVSSVSVTGVTPAGSAGAQDVVVTNSAGSATGTGAFTYT